MQNRREFLKQSCTACAGMIGLGLLAYELESCKTADTTTIRFTKNSVTVPLKQMEGKNYLLIKSASLEYDLVLVKKPEGDYSALQMICTHKQNPLIVTENGFNCAAHGSEFNFEGDVKQGPASTPLKKFPVKVEKNNALISLSA